MADAEARFAIDLDVGRAQASGNALGGTLEALRAKITAGSKALTEMQAAAGRLRASADVLKFEEAGKGLAKAQADVAKLESKITALQEKLGKTTNAKAISGITSQIADAQKGLGAAQGRVTQPFPHPPVAGHRRRVRHRARRREGPRAGIPCGAAAA